MDGIERGGAFQIFAGNRLERRTNARMEGFVHFNDDPAVPLTEGNPDV
jgi:hypothetical protein